MWQLYTTAKALAQRPSELVEVDDQWTALQFDSAVVWLGSTIESAAQERIKVGEGAKARWELKYKLSDLLTPGFCLEKPPTELERQKAAIASLKALAGVRVTKVANK